VEERDEENERHGYRKWFNMKGEWKEREREREKGAKQLKRGEMKGMKNSFVYVNMKKKCNISGFHGGDYEEWCLLGCYAVWLL
jgi:hypothetical protein